MVEVPFGDAEEIIQQQGSVWTCRVAVEEMASVKVASRFAILEEKDEELERDARPDLEMLEHAAQPTRDVQRLRAFFFFPLAHFARQEAQLLAQNDHPSRGALAVSAWHQTERPLYAWVAGPACCTRRVCTHQDLFS